MDGSLTGEPPMSRFAITCLSALTLVCATASTRAAEPAVYPLAVGVAQHAFDHLGNLGDQADAVAATGGTVSYATGCGGIGYAGLPPADEMAKVLKKTSDYNKHARD